MYKDYMAERKDEEADEFLHGVNFFDFYRSTFDIHTMLIESQNENAIFNAYLHFSHPIQNSTLLSKNILTIILPTAYLERQ